MFAVLGHVRKFHLGGVHGAEGIENGVKEVRVGVDGRRAARREAQAVLHDRGIDVHEIFQLLRGQGFQLPHLPQSEILRLLRQVQQQRVDGSAELSLLQGVAGIAGENIAVQILLRHFQIRQEIGDGIIDLVGLPDVGIGVGDEVGAGVRHEAVQRRIDAVLLPEHGEEIEVRHQGRHGAQLSAVCLQSDALEIRHNAVELRRAVHNQRLAGGGLGEVVGLGLSGGVLQLRQEAAGDGLVQGHAVGVSGKSRHRTGTVVEIGLDVRQLRGHALGVRLNGPVRKS